VIPRVTSLFQHIRESGKGGSRAAVGDAPTARGIQILRNCQNTW